MTDSIFTAGQRLSGAQEQALSYPLGEKLYLVGPAGTGKTTAAILRLAALLDALPQSGSILLLFPSRTLALPYLRFLTSASRKPGSELACLTIGGISRRMIDLFWQLIAEAAGFENPENPPIFLTLETAQYHLAKLVTPLLDKGFFQSVTIDRNRLFSQIIDNLNKSAAVGFPHTEIAARLKSAWIGDAEQLHIYDDVQECANQFRAYCFENNYLDFSLQIEIFRSRLWTHPVCRQYLTSTYRHLIYDNIEEDVPVAHDIALEWLPEFESALLIQDEFAGYRKFLGADPSSAERLADACSHRIFFVESLTSTEAVQNLQYHLVRRITEALPRSLTLKKAHPSTLPIQICHEKFYPAMLDWVAQQVASLVHEQSVPPNQIVILSPFLSDTLRFALVQRLDQLKVPTKSHRPSRSLSDEPVVHCLLTLTLTTFPAWINSEIGLYPRHSDFAYALIQAIQGFDLIRAQLLSNIVFRSSKGQISLSSFAQIKPDIRERITYRFGEKYEFLRNWMMRYQQKGSDPLDHFLSRLFGEVLSQPGFGFHKNILAGETTANLIESIQKFRWSLNPALATSDDWLAMEYLQTLQSGIIAGQYLRSWDEEEENAVLLAPAYTFLLRNRPVDYQFWLDIGSRSWSERLYQPLTHPYLLSRQWQQGRPWTDAEEVAANQDTLARLVYGLLRRCRKGIYLGISAINDQGYEQRGPLLNAFQHALKEYQGF